VGAALLLAAGIASLIGKKHVQQVPAGPQHIGANVKKDIDEVKEARHDH